MPELLDLLPCRQLLMISTGFEANGVHPFKLAEFGDAAAKVTRGRGASLVGQMLFAESKL